MTVDWAKRPVTIPNLTSIFCIALIMCLLYGQDAPAKVRPKLTGTYVYVDYTGHLRPDVGILRVEQTSPKKIDFSLHCYYRYSDSLRQHVGNADGTVDLVNGVAVYRNEESGSPFTLTMKFTNGKVTISQTGEGEFGANVRADGRYTRTSMKTNNYLKY